MVTAAKHDIISAAERFKALHESSALFVMPCALDAFRRSIAEKLDGTLLLPFGKEPHHPFIRGASRIEDVQPSRLGMMIHLVHGLWHAYRFAIALAQPIENTSTFETRGNICDQCQFQPCLKKCPVDAFDGTRYDVTACFNYLQDNPESTCHTSGCQARDS